MRPRSPLPNSGPTPQGTNKFNPVENLSQLMQDQPLLFWGFIWVSVLIVGAIAISGLLSPGVGGQRSSSAAFGSSTGAEVGAVSGEQKHVPFWLFGAIAVTCTAGSIMVSKRKTQTERTQRLVRRKRSSRYKAVTNQPKQPRSARHPKRLKPFLETEFSSSTENPIRYQSQPAVPPTSFKLPPLVKRQPPQTVKRVSPPVSATRGVAQATVTVVPSEQNHPLDWKEASLADTMDIRKRRSLTSWM